MSDEARRIPGRDTLFSSSPLQRCLRDMRAASQHILVGEDNHETLDSALVQEFTVG